MEIELKLKLSKEISKIINLGLNNKHLKNVTELTNKIWGCENIENHFEYFLNEIKQDYKKYKKFYIIKAE